MQEARENGTSWSFEVPGRVGALARWECYGGRTPAEAVAVLADSLDRRWRRWAHPFVRDGGRLFPLTVDVLREATSSRIGATLWHADKGWQGVAVPRPAEARALVRMMLVRECADREAHRLAFGVRTRRARSRVLALERHLKALSKIGGAP